MGSIPPYFIRKYGWICFFGWRTIMVFFFFYHFSTCWAFNYGYFVDRVFWLFTLFTCYFPNVSFKSYKRWGQFCLICKDFPFCPCVVSLWSIFTRFHPLRCPFSH